MRPLKIIVGIGFTIIFGGLLYAGITTAATVGWNYNGTTNTLTTYPLSTTNVTVTGNTTLATTTTGSLNGTIVVDGVHYAQTSAGIKGAMTLCGSNGIGNVYLPAATYTINSRITPVSNCHIYGAGKGATILQGNVVGDWDFYYSSAIQIHNFILSDMTIDLQNGTNASGVQLDNASTTVVQNVDFRNGAAGGWFLLYGANGSSATAPVQDYNNKIIDVDFTNHAGSLEALLVFNATGTQIVRPTLQNISSPGIGLWQKTYNTNIESLYCKDSSGAAFYYSITTEDTTVNNPKSDNCATLVAGANISDNGEFGLTQSQNLIISHPIAMGGIKSKSTFAIQLGAVNNAHVIEPDIRNYDIGISVNTGNNGAAASTTNWSIIGGSILDNNQENTADPLHPGIMIAGSVTGGAPVYGLIDGVKIYDDQASPNQNYPIAFDGNAVFDHMTITNNRLSVPAAIGGSSVRLQDGATLGTNVLIYANDDYSGTNPSQSLVSGQWTTSGTNIFYNGGNVGVGSSSPTALFTVTGGNISIDKNRFLILDGTNGTSHGISFDGASIRILNGGLNARFDNNGTASRFVIGADDINAKANINAAGTLNVGGTNAWIDNTPPTNGALIQGSVGIGTTTPGSAALSIQGNEFIAGNITSTSTTASIFPYATTTAISGTNLSFTNGTTTTFSSTIASTSLLYVNGLGGCVAGQYLTWSNGSFGCATDQTSAGASPFSWSSTFGTTTISTSTSFWTQGVFFSSSTVAASQFPYASTTQLSATNIDIENSSGGILTLGDNGANANQTFNLRRNGSVVGGISTSNSIFNFFGGTAVSNTNTVALRSGPSLEVGTVAVAGLSTFQVAGGTALGTFYAGQITAPADGLLIQGRTGIGTTTPMALLSIAASSTNSAPPLYLFAIGSSTVSATTTLFSINNVGTVFASSTIGIGTSSPMAQLAQSAASSTINFTPLRVISSIIAGVTYIFEEIDSWGHLITSGPTPLLSSCGTSTVSGNDRNGTITLAGVALTSCTLTFSHAFAAAPDCTVSDNTTASAADVDTTASTMTVGLSVGLNSGKVFYNCPQHQ